MMDALQQERFELKNRLVEIERELERRRRPEWLQDGLHEPFSQWAEHTGIEPLSPEADAAFDGWAAARSLYDTRLTEKAHINLPLEYLHQGRGGFLELLYRPSETSSETTTQGVMSLSEWSVTARSYFHPKEHGLPCSVSLDGDFLPTDAAERYLRFQARYWDTAHADRPPFPDALILCLPYGGRTLRKILRVPTVAPINRSNLERFTRAKPGGANFSLWFRSWDDL